MRRAGLVAAGLAAATGCFGGGGGALPGVPATVPAVGADGLPVAAPAAPAPLGHNLWSFLLPSGAQLAALEQRCLNSPLGQLLKGILSPLGALTGGQLGHKPPINPADLAQPAESPAGAAARIKQDQADVKARLAAVQYLATADCRYYKEAEAALINALRADRSECVRMEAARALRSGCCCGKKTIAALTRAVNGDDKDGNPGERSECVKALAFLALQRCLACYTEPAAQPEAGEKPKEPVQPAGYYERVDAAPAPVLAEARATLVRGLDISPDTLRQIGGPAVLPAAKPATPANAPAPMPAAAEPGR